jgi:5-methylcytosine-specific restriction endonuclease McrA
MTERKLYTHCAYCEKPLNIDKPNITHKKYCDKKCQDAFYYRNNREKVREKQNSSSKDQAKMKEYRKKWNQADPIRYGLSKRCEYSNKKAKDLGAEGKLKTADVIEAVNLHGWHCHYCKKILDIKSITLDHLTPFSRGGLNVIENIAPACGTCNRSKGTKTAEEYKNGRQYHEN